MGRAVSQCTELNNLLPKEQYGSRSRHQARHHGLNKRLLYDQAHLQRKPMILCINDAKSCYDRIVHSIASMAMQWLDMSPQSISCTIITIQEMDNYIITGFGETHITMYGLYNKGALFQGIHQGKLYTSILMS